MFILVSGELTYPFPTTNGFGVDVWEGISYFIPYFITYVITPPLKQNLRS